MVIGGGEICSTGFVGCGLLSMSHASLRFTVGEIHFVVASTVVDDKV